MDPSLTFEPYLLSPLDHLLPPIHMVPMVSFAAEDTKRAVFILARAVQRLIRQFPALTGDAVLVDTAEKTNVWLVQPTDSNMLEKYPIFMSKQHPHSISYIHDPKAFGDDFSAFPTELIRRDRYPTWRVQANEMQDGIILTIMFFHPFMDGTGFFSMLHNLSLCCHEVENPKFTTSPRLEAETRERISQIQKPDDGARNIPSAENTFKASRSSISRRLVFSNKRLKQLRDVCQSQNNAQSENAMQSPISTSDIMCAIVWLAIVQTRMKVHSKYQASTSSTGDTSFFTIIDGRAILSPDYIPPAYMGCLILFAASSQKLSSMSKSTESDSIFQLAQVARTVHESRQAVNKEFIHTILAQTAATSNSRSFRFASPEVGISNIRNARVYDWDFGPDLGFVQRFEMYDPRVVGRCWVLPADPSKGGRGSDWELSVALEVDAWEHLRDNAFIRLVSPKKSSKL